MRKHITAWLWLSALAVALGACAVGCQKPVDGTGTTATAPGARAGGQQAGRANRMLDQDVAPPGVRTDLAGGKK